MDCALGEELGWTGYALSYPIQGSFFDPRISGSIMAVMAAVLARSLARLPSP